MAQLVKNSPAMKETWVRSLVGKIPWRRERLPTPVFWPGEFHGWYSPQILKESDMTERLSPHFRELILQLETYATWLSRDGIRVSKRMLHEQLK